MPRSLVTDEQVFRSCEDFYKRDGFVKWADVARSLGISRQGVMHRLDKALKTGALDQATYVKWQSMSSRRAKARQNREDHYDALRRKVHLLFTPENYAWIRYQAELRQITASDIVNGLLNRAREDEAS